MPTKTKWILAAIAACALTVWNSTVHAQQAETFGRYQVHYNTLNTNLLTPEVARSYGIQRATTRAMLNVTVLDTETDEAVSARVTATATNLTGQRRELDMREIRDQGAIYYISVFRVHDEESMNFRIEVQPEGRSGPPFSLAFRQQFFTG